MPPVQCHRHTRPRFAPKLAAETSMHTAWNPHISTRHDPIRTRLGLLQHSRPTPFPHMPSRTDSIRRGRTERCRPATRPTPGTAATCTGAGVVPPRATATQTRQQQQLALCSFATSSSTPPRPKRNSPMGTAPDSWPAVEATRDAPAASPANPFANPAPHPGHLARVSAGYGNAWHPKQQH